MAPPAFCHKYIGMSQASSSHQWIGTPEDMQSGMAGLNLHLFRAATCPRRFPGEMTLRSSSAPQSIDVPGQILDMNIASPGLQNGGDGKFSLADLIMCRSEVDADFASGHGEWKQRTAVAHGQNLQAVFCGDVAHFRLRFATS